jgi:hypothetical protein
VFKGVSPCEVVVEDDDAQMKLEEQFDGVDAVVACIGSRQPGKKFPALKSRWCELGASKIAAAMASAGVQRLVLLSSFGIGDDYLPTSALTLLWSVMLRTSLRGVKRDIGAMESHIAGTALDYLLVRPSGLTPDEPPAGSWKVVTAKGQGTLNFSNASISKSDVGMYMLTEALHPSEHRRPVTLLGNPPSGKKHASSKNDPSEA